MAGSSLFALIDDIASVLDDVATLSKVALEKTAGVVGDDLALNAKMVVGVQVNRELPVVWAVAWGSLINKVILVPVALGISYLLPSAVTPLLMIGGAYLCYEGCEKLLHRWLHSRHQEEHEHVQHLQALAEPQIDLVALEKQKIRGAIRTDFVLSAEIIVIALGTVASEPFPRQAAVLSTIAILMTVGVYGLVACIIRMDDIGLYLRTRPGTNLRTRMLQSFGSFLLASAPWLMRALAIAGTAAMFMVGGGILTHGIPPVHHVIEMAGELPAHVPGVGSLLRFVVQGLLQALAGVVAGLGLVALSLLVQRLWKGRHQSRSSSSS